MADDNKKNALKQVRQRRYLNKDFDALRNDLLDYARSYFPNNIRDFSEASLGGLLLDMAAYVGDVQSYYLDHQFHESFPESSVEPNNIERHLRKAGVPIVGAAPAVVSVVFYIRVPTDGTNTGNPDVTALPIIKEGTIVRSTSGIEFELTENLDFSSRRADNSLAASVAVGTINANNIPQNYILSLSGICISGKRAVENFSLGTFIPYRNISLTNPNVTEIIKVTDALGNEYYEVESLTQDTIYKRVSNFSYDNKLVPENIVPIPAPYRFIKNTALQTRATNLIFGGGSASTINDDIIPDPSEYSLPLYGKKTFTRFNLNPGNLLQTTTFGVIAENTTLSITYRYGGGLEHNVDAETVNALSSLNIFFPQNPNPTVSAFVRNSIDVTNLEPASGGEDPPTNNELKNKIPAFQGMQNRIVSKQDLLARVYTLPSNFGRVFRAAIEPNPNNPLSSQLFIICRNLDNQLIVAPDTLKKNLATYLNQYRLISDAIDILDARVINVTVKFTAVIDPTQNRELVLRNTLNKLKDYFNIKNFEIDQPIVMNDIQNIIFNTEGVASVTNLEVGNVYNVLDGRLYSDQQFDIRANTSLGIIFGPPGSMFELKYADYDIVGTAV